MRDPQRIKPLLEKLSTYWRANPDLRLCQLIVDVAATNDPFYVEDDEFSDRLDEALRRYMDSKSGLDSEQYG